MNQDIAKVAKWAQSQGFNVLDDANGYTRFTHPTVTTLPALRI